MRKERPRNRNKSFRPKTDEKKIRDIIQEIDDKLKDSIQPQIVEGLNSFERRLIHRHYDHNPDVETRTYRRAGSFTLYVYPVANIENFAREKARQVLEQGESIDLPPMGSFERYIVHNCLKEIDGVETISFGEGRERHVQIINKKFGRGLKKIVKKIKLF